MSNRLEGVLVEDEAELFASYVLYPYWFGQEAVVFDTRVVWMGEDEAWWGLVAGRGVEVQSSGDVAGDLWWCSSVGGER